MTRSTSQTTWRTVRRLALAGKMTEVRELLERMVEERPEDREAADELARLKAGKPLHCTESKKEREQRITEDTREQIDNEVQKLSGAHTLSCMPTAELQSVRKTLQMCLRRLKELKAPAPEGTSALLRRLEEELKRRRKRGSRTLLYWGTGVLGILLLLAGTAWLLHRRADTLVEQLERVYRAGEWEKTAELLKATDTGINRLMSKKVEPLANRVRSWQQSVPRKAEEYAQRIRLYEKHHAISAISIEERGEFLRLIRSLPMPFSGKLLADWDELCRPEREVLEQQKRAAVARLSVPYPAPALSGNPEQDIPQLRAAHKELCALMEDFQNARDTFDLDPAIIAPNEKTKESVTQCLADAEGLTRALSLLSTARSYKEHLNALSEFKPQVYETAVRAFACSRQLPDEQEIESQLRSMRHKIPRKYPKLIQNAILNAGPNFGQGSPAGVEQLHLMEELFTTQTLRRPVYEVVGADGRLVYSDDEPSITDKGEAQVKRSELDPQYRPGGENQLLLPFANAMLVRFVDPRAIIKRVQLDRSTFFLKANLPELLGRITRIHDKGCPALAKAYVYNALLEIMRLHGKQQVFGVRFSPTLEKDIRSFRELRDSLKYPLTTGCWMSRTAAADKAEEAYSAWFSQNDDRDYAAEMSHNLNRILNERSRYIGYTDAECRPHYKITPAPKEGTLRYYSAGKLVATPAGAPLQHPDPLTPLFLD